MPGNFGLLGRKLPFTARQQNPRTTQQAHIGLCIAVRSPHRLFQEPSRPISTWQSLCEVYLCQCIPLGVNEDAKSMDAAAFTRAETSRSEKLRVSTPTCRGGPTPTCRGGPTRNFFRSLGKPFIEGFLLVNPTYCAHDLFRIHSL